MPKISYHPQTHDDPESTSTHGFSFEKGKAVEVPQHVHDKLSKNPWFRGDKGAAREAEAMSNPSVGEGGVVDSSIDVRDPPGVGSKTHPDAVFTDEGFTAPDSEKAKDAGNEVAKRGPGRPKA